MKPSVKSWHRWKVPRRMTYWCNCLLSKKIILVSSNNDTFITTIALRILECFCITIAYVIYKLLLNFSVALKGNSWVSATEVREGVWHWASLDKPLYHSRWFMDGQPDDKENLNCVYLASTAMLYWRDANCSASMYFICESRQAIETKLY